MRSGSDAAVREALGIDADDDLDGLNCDGSRLVLSSNCLRMTVFGSLVWSIGGVFPGTSRDAGLATDATDCLRAPE